MPRDIEVRKASIERLDILLREEADVGFDRLADLYADDIHAIEVALEAAKRLTQIEELCLDHLDYDTPLLHEIVNIANGTMPKPKPKRIVGRRL